MNEPLLEVRDLCKRYVSGDKQLDVLEDVSFDVWPGEIVAVIGESGTGKSTLLHILGTLDRPTAGEVRFRGESLFDKDDEALAHFRNRSIGFVFQFHHLLPEFTALENVAMPALIQNKALAGVKDRAFGLLEVLGLSGRIDHRPAQLSGGERQRVAVARAMMNAPDLLIADEPTGNLDTRTAEALHDEIVRLNKTMGQTFIIATHNPMLARRAHRVFRIAEGHLHTQSAENLAAAPDKMASA